MSIKKKMLIISFCLIIIIASLIYFIILPTLNDIQEISEAIRREKEELELKYKKGQLLKKISGDFKKIESQKSKLNAISIEKGKELEFVTTLENIAQKYNLQQSIKIYDNDIDKKQNIMFLPLNIIAAGDYNQALNYLYEIEKLSYYFNISEIEIKSFNSETGMVNINFIGKIYTKNFHK